MDNKENYKFDLGVKRLRKVPTSNDNLPWHWSIGMSLFSLRTYIKTKSVSSEVDHNKVHVVNKLTKRHSWHNFNFQITDNKYIAKYFKQEFRYIRCATWNYVTF